MVGAIALAFHKYPRATIDLDLIPELETGNLLKVISTLEAVGYKPRLPVAAHEMLDPDKRELWHREEHLMVFTFYKERPLMQAVDVMIYPPISYEACLLGSKAMDLEGKTIRIASINDLFLMKKSAMRQKDLTDIHILEQLLQAEEEERRAE